MTIEPMMSLASWADAEQLFRSRRDFLVPVDQPLVLISQVQRSGGTLLNSLLDGHPELHVYPYELLVGHPTKHDWPTLDLADGVDDWLETLEDGRVERLFREGYRKVGANDALQHAEALPFAVVPSLIAGLFRVLCHERPPATARDVLQTYFTAYFNAWMDCAGLREEPKRWMVAFGPRVAWDDSRARYLADYPDGRIIAIVRDPRGWYASARGFTERYRELDTAMGLWSQNAAEIAAAKREAPEQVLVLSYETLVGEPRRTMEAVSGWLGIAWDPTLLTPTFNRLPTIANSSHRVEGAGIRPELAERWRTVLEPDVVATLEARLVPQFDEVSALVDVPV